MDLVAVLPVESEFSVPELVWSLALTHLQGRVEVTWCDEVGMSCIGPDVAGFLAFRDSLGVEVGVLRLEGFASDAALLPLDEVGELVGDGVVEVAFRLLQEVGSSRRFSS